MDWRDQGALLSVRKHGETSVIIDVFTEKHGRHAGVVRGGTSRKIAPILQPGAQLDVAWRARLEEHIGSYTVEPLRSRATVLSDRTALAGLNAITSLLTFSLPEREPHPQLYRRTQAMLDLLGANEAWPTAYLKWELSLLDDLGFGLDLSSCAVTGAMDDLTYVSPKTGRAVSAEAAGEWADRLLPLPPELLGAGSGARENILAGLQTTGFFLGQWLAHALGNNPLPEPRARLIDRLKREVRDD
ncbi:DNA replication and repair protein RecO [Aliiroseovarius sediminilitoris]|uniref:DNA repair protein RecO n=1 Tax=Aliiroseovarius sediminilitoris TaxID=1173584 RepID=A0A1I0N408_9RHOB|nr:DNA repair protein RecO [Aliiroseovarius sediminilitoris]SEV95569.1 DNA replication and repair protein RecO [Aliiroseovarius sediminilitoris]